MSSNITDPANGSAGATGDASMTSPKGKGKTKAQVTDEPMNEEGREEEEEEEDDDDDGDEDEDEDEEDEEETYDEIDPSVITSSRTRGVVVDYTSKEALEKAGLTPADKDDDDEDPDVTMG